jgi:hypothetical protein
MELYAHMPCAAENSVSGREKVKIESITNFYSRINNV